MNRTRPARDLEKAVFTVSIDFELMWGTADRPYAGAFQSLCEAERRDVIDRLLGLFQDYDISATWAIVGHLFLAKPTEASKSLMQRHAGCPANVYIAPDLVERIRRCRVKQDIGSHTFHHLEMPSCSPSMADDEASECVRVAKEWGIDMKSFVFPRNRVAHLDVLKRHGFTCYRGPEPHWYRNQPRMVRRLGHLLDIATAKTPPSVTVQEEDGIWNIPGSMLYTPAFGSRRYVPVWMRVLRARRGLDLAVKQKQIFHLWFHPTDLACRTDAMIDGLRQIFEYASRLRESGKLVVRSMSDLVPAEADGTEEKKEVFVVA